MVVLIIYLPCSWFEERCERPMWLKDVPMVINGRDHLTRLPDDILPEFKRVFIFNGNIPIIPSNGFKNWKNVIVLRLISNNISTINPGAFGNIKSLFDLTISHNRLSRIQNGTFCPKQWGIQSLTLSYNQLADIHPGSFKCLNGLSHLILSFNQLTSLTWEVFLDTPLLCTLDIRNNQLANFEGDMPVLNNLPYVHLDGNVALPLHQLSKITHLRHSIHLSKCHLKDIYVDVNVSNQVLKQPFFLETSYRHKFADIDLSFNEITRLESVREICSISKYNSHPRTFLNLKRNSLVELPGFAFCFYKSFSCIDLRGNKIAVIDVNSFSGVKTLTAVYIYNNRLVACMFAQLPGRTLGLNNNKFIEVPILTKESLALTQLYLGGNKVSYTGLQNMKTMICYHSSCYCTTYTTCALHYTLWDIN